MFVSVDASGKVELEDWVTTTVSIRYAAVTKSLSDSSHIPHEPFTNIYDMSLGRCLSCFSSVPWRRHQNGSLSLKSLTARHRTMHRADQRVIPPQHTPSLKRSGPTNLLAPSLSSSLYDQALGLEQPLEHCRPVLGCCDASVLHDNQSSHLSSFCRGCLGTLQILLSG
jgi:hypothetical protein